MSRDKRGVVNPVVGGSSPPATAKLNNFRTNDLAEPFSAGSAQVSMRVHHRLSDSAHVASQWKLRRLDYCPRRVAG
jgi:hypothetical protein